MKSDSLIFEREYSCIDFYNRIAPYYGFIDAGLHRHKKPLIDLIKLLPAGKLLSVGVGYGKELSHFQKHRVTGIDHSKKMLDTAKMIHSNRPNILLKEMSAEHTFFKNESFDYIVISHVLSTCKNPYLVLKEASRILKTGGQLIILNHFTPKNFIRYFDKAFQGISKQLHFRSQFYIDDLPLPESLKVRTIRSLGICKYYKLIQIEKNHA